MPALKLTEGATPEPKTAPSILARVETGASMETFPATIPWPISLSQNDAIPTVRIHPATGFGLSESFFISTRRDCIVIGGGGSGYIGLFVDKDWQSGYSDGRCQTFEMDGVPLGSEAEDVMQFLGGEDEMMIPLNDSADEGKFIRRFDVRGVEIYSVDVNFVRKSMDVSEESITTEEARLAGKGFSRWVEGEDKWGELDT
jgi:hypothetical protein